MDKMRNKGTRGGTRGTRRDPNWASSCYNIRLKRVVGLSLYLLDLRLELNGARTL